tara:strand:- start:2281 stop:2514 length:234 start_codon:yes stop_codon:yes gene_type:complete
VAQYNKTTTRICGKALETGCAKCYMKINRVLRMTKRSDIIDGSSANAAKYGLIYTKNVVGLIWAMQIQQALKIYGIK